MESLIIKKAKRNEFNRVAPKKITLIGTLELHPNPYTIYPYIREQIYAIVIGHTHYILSVNDKWLWGSYPFSWKGIILTVGETIQVEGYLHDFKDEKDIPFTQIEITGLISR